MDITKITELESFVPEGGEYHRNQPHTLTEADVDSLQSTMDEVQVEPPECGKYGSNGGRIPVGTTVESVSISLPTSLMALSAQELPAPLAPVAAGATDCSQFSFYGDDADGILVPADAPNVPDATSSGSRTMTFGSDGSKSDQYIFTIWLDDTHVVSGVVLARVESAPNELYVDPEPAKQLLATAVSLIRE